ncbi:MAG: hypothetical protein E7Z80_00925 [Methanobrevibacter thaueri]|nr:hypothetical protein [Methanobrevibacter thaueri]
MQQKIEMQIPQEHIHTRLNLTSNNNKFNKFLNKEFEFPSKNLNEICEFIYNDVEMKKMIYNLPKIISTKLKYKKISLDFMKETDSNEKILEIIIYSNLNEEILLQKEDNISDEIIDNYPKTILEYMILVES